MTDHYKDTGDKAAIMHIQCEKFERELTAVTAQRDSLAEALDKVVDAWDHAEWLDENDFESFRAALQSLPPKP